jgi:glycyl-tRNA synthetase alpha chain
VQGVDRVFDLNFNGRTDDRKLTYGDVFLQAEQEYSRYNFQFADTELLLAHFRDARRNASAAGSRRGSQRQRQAPQLALPAYDQCIKASTSSICSTLRNDLGDRAASYILRVRELAKACAAWLQTEEAGT